MRLLILVVALAANVAAQGSLEIVAAYWGVNERFSDVTDRVRASVQNNSLILTPVVSSLGDPAPGIGKVLRVYYKANGQFNQGEWREGMVAQIAAPAGRALGNIFGNARGAILPLKITRAVYGKGSQIAEVGPLLQSKIVNNRLDLLINNANMGGDPAPQLVKDFLILYESGGRSQELHASEGDMLRLPDGITPAAPAAAPVGLRIVSAQYGLGNRMADVTALLQNRIAANRLSIAADNNSMGGDPNRRADKQLFVVYEMNGQRAEKRVNEGETLNIP